MSLADVHADIFGAFSLPGNFRNFTVKEIAVVFSNLQFVNLQEGSAGDSGVAEVRCVSPDIQVSKKSNEFGEMLRFIQTKFYGPLIPSYNRMSFVNAEQFG